MADTKPLQVGKSVTLDVTGAGTVELSPASVRGGANWRIFGVIVQTNRPGVTPIPRVQVFRDTAIPANSLGLRYDGSFGQGQCNELVSRGSKVIAQWTGGQAGDVATLTLTGEQW